MPKNKVSDPITDQEIAFARLVLSGAMTDRQAAEAAGLHPDSAAYTKSKPRVRDFMLEHRAAVQQQLLQQEADLSRRAVEEQHRRNLDREKVLNRLWEIASLSPEITRGSITGQVKALSMIVAIQNFIPTSRRRPSRCFFREQTPSCDRPTANPSRRGACPAAGHNHRPATSPGNSTLAERFTPSEAPPLHVPLFTSIPDLGVPSPIKNPFVRPAELQIAKKT